MNEITEEIFYDFLYTQNNIMDLIEEKTKELSIILHNRLPEGEICDVDIEEYTPGCIFVDFEEYMCGESCRDHFDLPIRFLWDDKYPIIYKEKINEEKRLEREEEKINIEFRKQLIEKHEREEYERLKSKYE